MGGYVSLASVDTTAEQIAHLRHEQAGAFSGSNGTVYSDVPYNFYVFPDGSIWEGRGWAYESGANGTSDLNDKYVAVQYVAGPTPDHSLVTPLTPAAMTSLMALWRDAAARFPAFVAVYPHSLVRPGGTECPGDALRAYLPTVNQNLRTSNPPTGDTNVAITAQEFDVIRGIVNDYVLSIVRQEGISGNAAAANAKADQILAKLGSISAGNVDYAALAKAVNDDAAKRMAT
jgi:hypothetical protein